jgi:hypothetical protein
VTYDICDALNASLDVIRLAETVDVRFLGCALQKYRHDIPDSNLQATQ